MRVSAAGMGKTFTAAAGALDYFPRGRSAAGSRCGLFEVGWGSSSAACGSVALTAQPCGWRLLWLSVAPVPRPKE